MHPDSTPDHALLGAARAGDQDAFGRFYVRHRETLLGYFVRRTGRAELAADLMAETFASALTVVVDKARPLPETPIAWLYTVARNLLIDSARRGRVEAAAREQLGVPPLELNDRDIERILDIAEASDLLRDVATWLSPAEWESFRARILEEESYAALAARLDCSEQVVRKRVSRARTHLRTVLRGNLTHV